MTRGEDNDEDEEERLSTSDKESLSNGGDDVRLLRDQLAATVVVVVP